MLDWRFLRSEMFMCLVVKYVLLFASYNISVTRALTHRAKSVDGITCLLVLLCTVMMYSVTAALAHLMCVFVLFFYICACCLFICCHFDEWRFSVRLDELHWFYISTSVDSAFVLGLETYARSDIRQKLKPLRLSISSKITDKTSPKIRRSEARIERTVS